MKKTVFFSFLLGLFSMDANAQQFGIIAGGGLSKRTGTSDWSNVITDPLFTLNGQVFTEIELGKKKTVSLLPALGFTSKGIVYRNLYVADVIGNEIGESDIKSRISYLQLDIPFCYGINQSKANQLLVGAGPYLAYAISGKTRYFNYSPAFGGSGGELPKPSKIDFKKENISRFDAGLVFQATAVFSKRFCAGLKWDIGLTNLYNSGVRGDSHNRMFGLNIGYLFNTK